jgi:hypothetical protein
MMTSGCATDVNQYHDQHPVLDVRDYFDGRIVAWGFVQNWRGRVQQRFDIEMVGTWDGDRGTLDETFHYYDGTSSTRVWRLQRLDDSQFTGTAEDVVGTAHGRMAGNAINMKYRLQIPFRDGKLTLTLDDWMWLMNEGVVINRTSLRKFGIKVGEVTVFMKRVDD